jgi:hypothetical protein
MNVKSEIADFIDFTSVFKDEYSKNILLSLLSVHEQLILQDVKKCKIPTFIFKSFFSNYNVDFINSFGLNGQILFWPVQLNHLDYLIPVYKALPCNSNPAFICFRPDLLEKLKESNLPFIEIKINHTFKIKFKNIKRGVNLIKIIFRAMFFYDFKMFKVVRLIATIQHFSYYEIYSKLFFKVKICFNPKYNLLGYEHSLVCKPINILSNKYGIPCGNIQHGALNENLMPYSICFHQFVWNSFVKNQYKNSNFNIYVTGSPNTNHYKNELDYGEEFKLMFKNNSIVLVCYSGPGHNITVKGHLRNLEGLLMAVRKFLDYKFVIKLHNKDKIEYYNIFKNEVNVIIIDQTSKFFTIPILNFIKESKLIITGASTVAIEAIEQGIPAICMDLNKELCHIEFIKSQFFYYCDSESDFDDSLLSIFGMDKNYIQKIELISHFHKSSDLLKLSDPAKKISKLITKSIK